MLMLNNFMMLYFLKKIENLKEKEIQEEHMGETGFKKKAKRSTQGTMKL